MRRRWISKLLNFKIPSFKEFRSWRRINRKFRFYLGGILFACVFLILGCAIVHKLYDFQSKKLVTTKAEVKKEAKKEEVAITKIPKVRVAIILDDAGEDTVELEEALSIRAPLTISILPGLPKSAVVANRVLKNGKEVMLHLPMEPVNGKYVKYDNSMILVSMQDKKIKEFVERSINEVPAAIGVNNHMGSKATQDRRVMNAALDVVKEKGLYFVDSRTSRSSIAYEVAREKGLKSFQNYIFLDVNTSPEVIEKRLMELVAAAQKKGKAIGIGHITRKETIDVLKRKIPEYEAAGVKFVSVSDLVE